MITTNNCYGQRLCLEAWHINMNDHALNRDDRIYLPQIMSPLEYIRSCIVTLDQPPPLPPMKTLDWSVETLVVRQFDWAFHSIL